LNDAQISIVIVVNFHVFDCLFREKEAELATY
jgi:hypothetical protein